MRKLALFLTLALASCIDTQGITDASHYLDRVLQATEVSYVVCDASVVPVGEETECRAYGLEGTELSAHGLASVVWTTSYAAVATVDLAGVVRGIAPGEVFVAAEGPRGSIATWPITVVE